LRLENLKRVEASEADLSKYRLRQGDLLFNTRNSKELVGKTAVVRSAFDGIYNNNILRIRFDKGMTGDFLDAFLRTRKGSAILGAIKSGTTSVFAIYQKSFLSLEVPVPPIDLQHRYSDRIRELFLIQGQLAAAATRASKLFASLQQRAFRGEL
jgi:type I restriction enzyme S subunit